MTSKRGSTPSFGERPAQKRGRIEEIRNQPGAKSPLSDRVEQLERLQRERVCHPPGSMLGTHEPPNRIRVVGDAELFQHRRDEHRVVDLVLAPGEERQEHDFGVALGEGLLACRRVATDGRERPPMAVGQQPRIELGAHERVAPVEENRPQHRPVG